MSATSIQWTDAVWNPVRGCSRVSPGCDNCYAMRQAHRFSGPGKPYEGLTTIRRGKVDWSGRVRLVPEILAQPLHWKKPRRIFVNSMSDLFHESLTNEEIAAVFGVMAACPWHTFQVLTKRPKRAREWFEWIQSNDEVDPPDVVCCMAARVLYPGEKNRGAHLSFEYHAVAEDWPLSNVWFGVSAENQETWDERVATLVHGCPAAVHFVSCEPLLGPIDIRGTGRIHVQWLIAGGESGNGARPSSIEWFESLRDQCAEAGVAFFLKQLGTKITGRDCEHGRAGEWCKTLHRKGGDPDEWPAHLRVREFPEVRHA